MKKNFKLLVLLCLVIVAGCKETKKETTETTQETLEISHAYGTVEVVKNPERVVALDFASLEMLDLLGVEVVGVPKASMPDHLVKYANDTNVADLGNLKEINFETLNELQPDVIFMSGRLQNSYDEIAEIAPTVYTEIDYKNYLSSVENNAQLFSNIFNDSLTAQKALNGVKKNIDLLKSKVEESDKRALVVLHNKGRFSAYGKGSRFGIIHDVFGMDQAVEDLEAGRHGQRVSNEFIQNANPDYLFIIDRSAVVDQKATNKEEIENQLIQQTNAYKNGKIIYLNPKIWYLSGGGIYSLNNMVEEVSKNL